MALLKMPLEINGVSFSALTERLGYSIVYVDRKGGNTMSMQNGDIREDILTRRPVITWRLDSLTMTELASLHQAIDAAVYVPVKYYDTRSAALATWQFHCTISAQEVGVIRPGGYYRFRAPVLTATPL